MKVDLLTSLAHCNLDTKEYAEKVLLKPYFIFLIPYISFLKDHGFSGNKNIRKFHMNFAKN